MKRIDRSVFFISALLLTVFLSGCFGPKEPPRYLDEGEHHLVRLERAPDSAQYDHPAELDPEVIRGALGSLVARHEVSFLNRILTQQKEIKVPAFTPEETTLLSGRLKEALAKATPGERVAFFLTHRKDSLTTEVTTGVAYIQNKELQLIFANDHTAVSNEHHPYIQKENPLHPYEPGSFALILQPHQRKISEGVGHGMQAVAVDLTAPATEPMPAPSIAETNAETKIEEKKPLPSDVSPHSNEGANEGARENLRLEGQLRLLKKWKEEGLITEDEYKDKKAELLKSLDVK